MCMMWGPAIIYIWLVLDYAMIGGAERDTSCQDISTNTCRKIGSRLPLSKCYTKSDRCCATCERLRLPNPGCPFGDRASSCESIGSDDPISDCYTKNATCCETCPQYSRGTPGCEFGDKLNSCSEIGSRFLISACYQKEETCCDTCARFKKSMPGCEYGDHENWCSVIGIEFCMTDPHTCCETCAVLMATATRAPPIDNNRNSSNSQRQNSTTTHSAVTSAPHTYTGSPGRPGVNNNTVHPVTLTPVIHSHPTASSTKPQHQNPDLNSTKDDTSNSKVKNSTTNSEDLNIICQNMTGHRLRHNKHGGRHRTRHRGQHIDPRCLNITTTQAPRSKTSEPLWLLISKGMPPQTTSVTPSTRITHKTSVDKADEQTTLSDSKSGVSMTTLVDAGMMGEMDYQENPIDFSAGHHSTPTVCSVFASVYIYIVLLYS